jgi:hypothetical protein
MENLRRKWFLGGKESRRAYWVCKTRPRPSQILQGPRNPPTWVRLYARTARPLQIWTLFSSNQFSLVPYHKD